MHDAGLSSDLQNSLHLFNNLYLNLALKFKSCPIRELGYKFVVGYVKNSNYNDLKFRLYSIQIDDINSDISWSQIFAFWDGWEDPLYCRNYLLSVGLNADVSQRSALKYAFGHTSLLLVEWWRSW